MKEKIKRISSSTWALILALMMVVSSFSVLAATTNVEKTGGSDCFTANQTLYVDIGNTWESDFESNVNVPYVTFSYSTADNDLLNNAISRVSINKSDKVSGSIYKITVPNNNYCRAIRFERTKNGEPSTIWDNVLTTSKVRSSDDQNLFTISGYNGNNGWSIYSGGSTTTDLYLCGWINNKKVDHKNASYKLTQSDDKYTGTFTFSTDTQYVTISNGTKAYVASSNNASNGAAANSNSPTNDDSNPDDKWMVDTSSSKTITFTWDDTNKTLSWVSGSVEPTETTTTTTTPTPSKNYYICGSLVNSGWNTSYKDSPFIWSESDNFYISKTSFKKPTSNIYFRIHDGTTIYGPDSTDKDIPVKSTKEAKLKENSETKAFLISSQNITNDYYLCTDGEYVWYKIDQDPVATSVSISPDATEKSVGDSVRLTANVTGAKSENLKYKFTEVNENGSEVGTPVTSNTKTVTYVKLTVGTHYYKVEVSAEGYKSVTATTSITVKKHNIATSVSLVPLLQEVTYGNDVQVTAELSGKYEGYTGNVTYTLLDENGKAVSGVDPITTNQTNVVFTVTKPSTGDHTYKVAVSAENYETVESNTVSVYVKQTDITSKVTLSGPISGCEYKVGDSIKLNASCEDAPEGVTVKYNYYINGNKINDSATPNTVTYNFTASDVNKCEIYAEAVADGYNTVKSEVSSVKVIMKQVATSVKLTATPTDVKVGNEVTITAELQGEIQSGNFTYTFRETAANGDIQSVQSDNGSATIVTSDLSVGKHYITVEVSGTNFQSIKSTVDLIVNVSEAYHNENVNKTSGKTMIISYDKAYAGTTDERNAIFAWGGASIDDAATESDKKMTKYSQSDIPGLYYKQLDNYVTSASTGIQFIIKQVGKWDNQSSDLGGDKFIKGKQWYFYGTKEGKNVDANAAEYTPLTFTKLSVPTEINDDDSTQFVFTVGGGLPNFFKNVVQSTTIKPEYTVTITDPDNKVVGTASSNDTEITLDKLILSKDGKYTFTVTDGIDTVSYTKDITVTPLVVDNYNATVNASDNATITVTCKNTTITGGNTGELPGRRNATISVTGITEGYKVKSVSVKSGVTDIPVTSQGSNKYLFTMPSSDVTITVDVVEKSKYVVNFGVSDKTNGSITAKAGSTSIKSGERITEDTEVTFTVSTSSGYAVDGWYSDASYKNKIDDVDNNATTYTTTISKTTDVYVKISEDAGKLEPKLRFVYGSSDDPTKWTNVADVYSKTDGSYYVKLDYTKLNKSTNYYYGLSGTTSMPLASVDDLYWQNDSDTVTYSSTNSDAVENVLKDGGYGVFKHYGYFVLKDTSNMFGLTMKITQNTGNNGGEYQIIPSVKTAPEGALEVYAKDGTLLTTSGYGDTTVSGMNADCEGFVVDNGTYKQYAAMPGDRLTITTVVNDAQAEQGWYVSNYVINGVGYDAISTVIAQAAVQAGSTGASYTISTPYSVTGKETKNIIEITPIYKNRNIEAANDYITLYANADSLGDAWGNTISVYAYYYKESGSTDAYHMNSAYPGDPMMKTSSGLFVSYVPKHYWQANGSKMTMLTNTVSGITFNNYAENETVHKKVLEGKYQLQNNQTYDYDDFKLIADAGYDTVLYDFKYYNNSTTNQSTLVSNGNTYDTLNPPDTIDPSVYEDADHNGWEVLTNMDNEEVSLLGYSARNASTIGKTFDNTNRLHIVSVGNINTTMGVWSTVWFVYDKDNNFITKGIPSDFIPRYTKDKDNKQVESETQTAAYKAIKNKQLEYTGAYITYESEMGAGTSTDKLNTGVRSDGRWYYSRAVDQVKVNTHVLYADNTDSASWKEDNYGSDYAGTFTGAKALVGTERSTSVDRNSEVSISATALSQGTTKQYKFIGWTANATKGENGTYTIVKNPSMTDSAQTVKVSTNMDLYALYIPVAEGDLIITHEKFTGEKAYGGPGKYFVQATLYDATDTDKVIGTYYQEGSVTIPDYTENSGRIEVQLIVYSVNGSRYKATYNYQSKAITDTSHLDKVCSSGDPAVVERTINASDVFDGNTMKTSKIDFYSDLQTNNITVKMNYYNRKVENGKPADMDSTPTSYSYRFTSYPSDVLNTDNTLSIPKLIEYAKNHSQQPDNMIEKYISWNSQDDALKGIVGYTNYHTNTNDNYEATPYHTDQYGNVQKTGEKWVTYYDRNGVEVAESEANAETVSSISIWYFNTPKKYTYTLNTANSSDNLVGNGDGTYYGKVAEPASGLFYNTRLFTSDREVSDATSPYTEAYGVEHGFTGQAINTAETINNNGTALKFLYWAYDTAGKKIASTNIQYGLRITNNTTLYAIYGKNEITAPGLTVQEVTPDTFFDSNNISKTRINTIFNPYNCKDNDKNIDSASVVYLRVSNATTEKSLNNLNDADLQKLRKQISTVVSKASYEKFKSGTVDAEASQTIVQISGSTASGFKLKIVDAPSSSSTELQTSLSNKNRGQFTTTFTTSTLKNYTYYVFATMGYKNYNGTADKSVVTGSDGIAYITSDNFAKYDFDKDGKYVASSNS